MRCLIVFFLLGIIAPVSSAEAAFDHGTWNELLQNHVVVLQGGKSTQVDYQTMGGQRPALQEYLQSLSSVRRDQFDGWDKAEQLAFLLNAYNAWTVELILTRYPDLKSIKDLGSLFQSPWKRRFIPLFDTTVSLDGIEHDLIRGSDRYNDPRIHFAVNCASIGCPALRNEAYLGASLDGQLEEAALMFLSDTSRNRVHDGLLEVSSIFKWYGNDFARGWRGAGSLQQFFALYSVAFGLSEEQVGQLRSNAMNIRFLDYDWALNDTQ